MSIKNDTFQQISSPIVCEVGESHRAAHPSSFIGNFNYQKQQQIKTKQAQDVMKQVPDEVIFIIFSYLEASSLCITEQVCKKWKSFFEKDERKYENELWRQAYLRENSQPYQQYNTITTPAYSANTAITTATGSSTNINPISGNAMNNLMTNITSVAVNNFYYPNNNTSAVSSLLFSQQQLHQQIWHYHHHQFLSTVEREYLLNNGSWKEAFKNRIKFSWHGLYTDTMPIRCDSTFSLANNETTFTEERTIVHYYILDSFSRNIPSFNLDGTSILFPSFEVSIQFNEMKKCIEMLYIRILNLDRTCFQKLYQYLPLSEKVELSVGCDIDGDQYCNVSELVLQLSEGDAISTYLNPRLPLKNFYDLFDIRDDLDSRVVLDFYFYTIKKVVLNPSNITNYNENPNFVYNAKRKCWYICISCGKHLCSKCINAHILENQNNCHCNATIWMNHFPTQCDICEIAKHSKYEAAIGSSIRLLKNTKLPEKTVLNQGKPPNATSISSAQVTYHQRFPLSDDAIISVDILENVQRIMSIIKPGTILNGECGFIDSSAQTYSSPLEIAIQSCSSNVKRLPGFVEVRGHMKWNCYYPLHQQGITSNQSEQDVKKESDADIWPFYGSFYWSLNGTKMMSLTAYNPNEKSNLSISFTGVVIGGRISGKYMIPSGLNGCFEVDFKEEMSEVAVHKDIYHYTELAMHLNHGIKRLQGIEGLYQLIHGNEKNFLQTGTVDVIYEIIKLSFVEETDLEFLVCCCRCMESLTENKDVVEYIITHNKQILYLLQEQSQRTRYNSVDIQLSCLVAVSNISKHPLVSNEAQQYIAIFFGILKEKLEENKKDFVHNDVKEMILACVEGIEALVSNQHQTCRKLELDTLHNLLRLMIDITSFYCYFASKYAIHMFPPAEDSFNFRSENSIDVRVIFNVLRILIQLTVTHSRCLREKFQQLGGIDILIKYFLSNPSSFHPSVVEIALYCLAVNCVEPSLVWKKLSHYKFIEILKKNSENNKAIFHLIPYFCWILSQYPTCLERLIKNGFHETIGKMSQKLMPYILKNGQDFSTQYNHMENAMVTESTSRTISFVDTPRNIEEKKYQEEEMFLIVMAISQLVHFSQEATQSNSDIYHTCIESLTVKYKCMQTIEFYVHSVNPHSDYLSPFLWVQYLLDTIIPLHNSSNVTFRKLFAWIFSSISSQLLQDIPSKPQTTIAANPYDPQHNLTQYSLMPLNEYLLQNIVKNSKILQILNTMRKDPDDYISNLCELIHHTFFHFANET